MPGHRAVSGPEIEAVFRQEYGRAVAVLIRLFGDIDAAEEAVQDAFTAAVQRWPENGMPPSPPGWIITTARNRAIDRLRREASREDRQAQAALLHAGYQASRAEEDTVPDDRLRLIFTCCHPALALQSQVALTLRLLAVLAVVYLIFNEGHTATSGDMLTREDLAAEAIRLGRLLARLMPDEPEVLGLLALMILIESRRAARVGSDGGLVLLGDQDRAVWDRDLIAEGQAIVRRCLRRGQPGPYQIQAAINAVHADARLVRSTDWAQILQLYDQLLSVSPGPVVALNRAVALSEVNGPAAALVVVDDLAANLDGYYLFHAIRADLLRRLGRAAEAAHAYEAAIARTANKAEREFLGRGLRAVRPA